MVSAKPSITPKLREETIALDIRASLSNTILIDKAKAKKYSSKISQVPQVQQQRSFK